MRFFFIIFLIFNLSFLFAAEEITSPKDSSKKSEKENQIKIGVVNIDRIILESKSIRDLIKNVEEGVKVKQDLLDKKNNEFKSLKKKIDQQKEILTKEQIEKNEQELTKLKESIDDLKYEIDKIVRRSEKETFEPAMSRIIEAIKSVAEEKELKLVFPSEVVIYLDSAYDITDFVIARLDEKPQEKIQEKPREKVQEKPEEKPREKIQEKPTPTPQGKNETPEYH